MPYEIKTRVPSGQTYALIETQGKTGDQLQLSEFKKISSVTGIELDGGKITNFTIGGSNQLTIGQASGSDITAAARIALIVYGIT